METMTKKLMQSAWELLKRKGPLALIRGVSRYLALYWTPDKIIKYGMVKLSRKNEPVVKVVQNSKMLLEPKSGGIHMDLFLNGIRESICTQILQDILEPDMVVVDIGANIGYYALMEAREVKKVYAIEPEPKNYEALLVNIQLNKYTNVEAHNLAIGDRNGKVLFDLANISNWHRVSCNNTEGNTIEVPMATLDTFLKDKEVHLIRMDVEGYELNILKGAKEILERHPLHLFLEVHRDYLKEYRGSTEELLELLDIHGFTITHSILLGRPGPTGPISNLSRKEKEELTTSGASFWWFLKK